MAPTKGGTNAVVNKAKMRFHNIVSLCLLEEDARVDFVIVSYCIRQHAVFDYSGFYPRSQICYVDRAVLETGTV